MQAQQTPKKTRKLFTILRKWNSKVGEGAAAPVTVLSSDQQQNVREALSELTTLIENRRAKMTSSNARALHAGVDLIKSPFMSVVQAWRGLRATKGIFLVAAGAGVYGAAITTPY